METETGNLLCNGRGVQHILNCAYEILGNPVALHGMRYNLLAYSENTVIDDPIWNELISIGKLSHKTVDFFNSENFIVEVADSSDVVILKTQKLKYDRIAGKIFDKNGDQIAVIAVVGCYKPLGEQDLIDSAIICEYLSREIQSSDFYENIEQLLDQTIVSDIIDGNFVEQKLLDTKLNELYVSFSANIFVAVVDITQYEHTVTHLVYFRDLLKDLQPEYKYFIYLNNIVVLISCDCLTLNPKKQLTKWLNFFEKYKIYAGISGSFSNLLQLKSYYKQALNALNYGLASNSDNVIFSHHDFMPEYLINSAKDYINIHDYVHPIVFNIIEYDAKNSTNYYDVIRAHLPYTANASKQLDCQLENLSKLFDIDWENCNLLLSIALSVKIITLYSDL